MILRTLRIKNYRRHVDTQLEFPDGVVAIVGANGSGKSTILEAIGFALFGLDAVPGAKELIPHGHGDVEVSLELILGDQEIIVSRALRGKSMRHEANLQVGGTPVLKSGANSAKACTEHITKLLGMDQSAFYTTIVARQKELSRLQQMGAAARKKLILDMLGIGRLDRGIQQARSNANDAKRTLEGSQKMAADPIEIAKQLQESEAKLQAAAQAEATALAALDKATLLRNDVAIKLAAALETQQARQRQEVLVREATLKLDHERAGIANLNATVEGATKAANELAKLPPDNYSALQNELQQHQHQQSQFNQFSAQQKRRAELNAQMPTPVAFDEPAWLEAKADVLALRDALATLKEQTRNLRDRNARLTKLGSDAPCPTCEQPVGDHKEKLLRELQQEHVALGDRTARVQAALDKATELLAQLDLQKSQSVAAERELEKITALLQSLDAPPIQDPGEPTEILANIEAAKAVHEQRVSLQLQAKDLDRLHADLAAKQSTLAAHTADLDAAKAKLAKMEDVTQVVVALKPEHAAADLAYDAAQKNGNVARTSLALAKQLTQQLRDKHDAAKAQQETLRGMEAELARWHILVNRNKGILEQFRDHIVDRIGPRIQDEASRLLGLFTAGRYPEILLDEGYEIHVTDEGTPYEISRFSGGEEDLVHLSLRLAVSRMLAERSGHTDLRFIALDEVFGALDRHRRGAVLHALQGLTQLYRQVLVITHEDALRDSFDATWHVQLQDGRSVVTQD